MSELSRLSLGLQICVHSTVSQNSGLTRLCLTDYKPTVTGQSHCSLYCLGQTHELVDVLIQWSYCSSWPTVSSDWAPRLEELLTEDRGAPLLCLLLLHLKCVTTNTKALLRTHQVNSLQLILDGVLLSKQVACHIVHECACTTALLFYPCNKELRYRAAATMNQLIVSVVLDLLYMLSVKRQLLL